jgi:hypothetical protein
VFKPGFMRDWGVVHDEVREDLVVLDGSIIPCALGINPALTIAAVALRALTELRQQWLAPGKAAEDQQLGPMPPRREIKVPVSKPTRIRILERMTGEVLLEREDKTPEPCIVDLRARARTRPLAEQNPNL